MDFIFRQNLRYEELPYTKELQFSELDRFLKEKIKIDDFTLDVLKTLGLYSDGNYNNGAALLADKNIFTAACGVDMVRFGDSENIFLDRKTFKGVSLLLQYENALSFFDKWYAPYEEVVGFYRQKRIHIPREAFREAIANALCHRDFSINALIRVAAYKDRIEITSPGSLPSGISREEFLEGKFSPQERREKILFNTQ